MEPAGVAPSFSPQDLKEWIDSSRKNDIQTLRRLFAKDSSLLNAKQGGLGNTALHWAAARDYCDIVEFLVKSSASLSIKNNSGSTPLHSAAANGSTRALKILLQSGVDLSVQDEDGLTALDIASKRISNAEQAAAEGKQDREENQSFLETMREVEELLELQQLINLLRSDESEEAWNLHNLNSVLSLANIDRAGLLDKEDLSRRVKQYLSDLEEGKAPLRQAKSFLQSRYGRTEDGHGGQRSQGAETRGGQDSAASSGASSDNDKVAKLKQKGNEAFGNKDMPGAIRYYTMAIRLDEHNHVMYSNRSAAYAALGDWFRALEDAEFAIELRPDWARGYSRKGAALAGRGIFDKAVEAYKKGLELEPNNQQMQEALRDAEFKWATGAKGKPAMDVRGKGSQRKQDNDDDDNDDNAESCESSAQQDAKEVKKPKKEPEGNRHSVTKDMGKQWLKAAKEGNLKTLKSLLEERPEILRYQGAGTRQASVGHSALHWCAAKGHSECLEFLLESKADPDVQNNGGSTPLHAAAQNGQESCVQVLLRYKADPGIRDKGGANAEQSAARIGHSLSPSILSLLQGDERAAQKSPETQQDHPDSEEAEEEKDASTLKEKGNAMFAEKKFAEAVKYYSKALKLDASNKILFSNRSAAYLGLGRCKEAIRDAQQCIDLDPDWAKGYSRKGAACLQCGDTYDAVVCYRTGLEKDPSNGAMQDALKNAEVRLRELTAQWDELPCSDDEDGERSRGEDGGARAGDLDEWWAERRGGGSKSNFEAPREIDFADQSVPRQVGKEFMDAAKNGHQPTLERMLLERPDLLWYRGQGTSYGFVGHSALHFTAAKGHMDCMRLLMLAGADVNAQNRGGTSVLHSAAMNDNVQAVELLLSSGANPNTPDQDGEKAEDSARRRSKTSAANAIAKFSRSSVTDLISVCMPKDKNARERMRAFLVKLDQAKAKFAESHEGKQESGSSAADVKAEPLSREEGRDKESVDGGEGSSNGRHEGPGFAEEKKENKEKKEKKRVAKQEDLSSDSDDGSSSEAMKKKVEAVKMKGDAAFKRKDYTAAVASYSIAVRLDPNNHILLSNRSAAYAGLEDYEHALEDANKVVKLAPDWAKGYSRKGAALHGQRQWAEAVKVYKQGLKLDPDNALLKDGVNTAIASIREATGEEPTWLY